MKHIEEMVKLFKSKSQFGFYVSIFLVVSFLIIIPLVNDLLTQLILGLIIILVLIKFFSIMQERNRLNQVLRNYQKNPQKSLNAVNTHINIIKNRMKKKNLGPNEKTMHHKKTFKHEEELLRYEQLLDAIKEQHPQL